MTAFIKATILLACALTYSYLAHRITLTNESSPASYGFALAVPAAAGVLFAIRARSWQSVSIIVATGLAAWWLTAHRHSISPSTVLLAQHAGVHATLGLIFGLSLLPGRESLVTRMARLFHDRINPEITQYTRGVTITWTLYFAIMTGVSVSLFAMNFTYAWSVLANFVTLPLIVLIFVVEMIIRRRRLPNMAHASFSESLDTFSRIRNQSVTDTTKRE